MNPDYLHRLSGFGTHERKPQTWRYCSNGNIVERVTSYRNKVEVVAMCATPAMAAEIAKAMEARPERDLADEDEDE